MKLRITVLEGDGIGPEVTREAVSVLTASAAHYGYDFRFDHRSIGGAAIREHGSPLPPATLAACLESDAVLLGAVGGPEFDALPAGQRPESGLLALRRALGGYANLRPAVCYPAIADCSPLRREVVEGADVLVVRELLGGLYFSEPRGFNDKRTAAFNTMRYTAEEVERVARVAFGLARTRRRKLTSVDKANVLETSQLWREVVIRVARDFPDVTLEHIYVDACALRLMLQPTSFDVILTENLFGDILSDEAAALSGSLGMLASATIGGQVALYEPVHGSAPDIAGQNSANPLGAIATAALLLRYTARNEKAAKDLETAIGDVLAAGFRTRDLCHGGHRFTPKSFVVSTKEMGAHVRRALADVIDQQHTYHAV